MATRIEQVSEDALRLNQWTLYPAMVRLQQQGWIKGAWRKTENNREAKYYAITKAGQKALVEETPSALAANGWPGGQAFMRAARVSPSRHLMYRSLWVPGRRAEPFFLLCPRRPCWTISPGAAAELSPARLAAFAPNGIIRTRSPLSA